MTIHLHTAGDEALRHLLTGTLEHAARLHSVTVGRFVAYARVDDEATFGCTWIAGGARGVATATLNQRMMMGHAINALVDELRGKIYAWFDAEFPLMAESLWVGGDS